MKERNVIDLTNDADEETERKAKKPRAMIPITNGWVVYKPNHSQVTFEEFIELYDPSKMANRESAWIAAESPNHNMLHEAVSDVPSLIVAWESLPPEGKSADLLESLAKEYNVVVGKWMLFTSRDKAKDTWKRIAKDVTEGNLGSSAKISTLSNDSMTLKQMKPCPQLTF